MGREQGSYGQSCGWKGSKRQIMKGCVSHVECPKGNKKPFKASKHIFENEMFVLEGSFGHKVGNGLEGQDQRQETLVGRPLQCSR